MAHPSIQEIKFLGRTGAKLHSPKPQNTIKWLGRITRCLLPPAFALSSGFLRQWPAGKICLVPCALAEISFRSEASLQLSPNHFFSQFNQKVLRTLRFHQHHAQQPKDGLYMWRVGHPRIAFPCKWGYFKTMKLCFLIYSFISARPAYCEATTKGHVVTWLGTLPDRILVYLKIPDHKHFICSKSIIIIPCLIVQNKEWRTGRVTIFADNMDWCDVSDMWFIFLWPGVPHELDKDKTLLR